MAAPLTTSAAKPSAADEIGLPVRVPSNSDRNFPVPIGLSGRIGPEQEADMNGLIYLVGLIVVILAVLSFFGLR